MTEVINNGEVISDAKLPNVIGNNNFGVTDTNPRKPVSLKDCYAVTDGQGGSGEKGFWEGSL